MSQQPPAGPPNPAGPGWGGPPQGPPPGQGPGQPPGPYGPPGQQGAPPGQQGPPPGEYGPPPGQQGPPPGQQAPAPGQYGPPPRQSPYGPPGQYPGGPMPSGDGKSKGMIIGVVIAVLVVVGGGAAAAILLLGGDNEPSGDDPLATAQAFVDAWKDADCDALEGLLTEDFLNGAGGDCDPDDIQGEPSDPEITDESDDKATAVINLGGSDLELTLVMADGKWLIDGIGASETVEPPSASPSS